VEEECAECTELGIDSAVEEICGPRNMLEHRVVLEFEMVEA
jgi:hypothetical protein